MTAWKVAPPTEGDDAVCGKVLSDWIDETPWMPRIHTPEEDRGFVARLFRGEARVLTRGGAAQGFIAREGDWISALYLAPDARGAGGGKALLDWAKTGRPALSLWTFAANTGARAFYIREGFTETGGTDGDNDEGLPDIRLDWTRG